MAIWAISLVGIGPIFDYIPGGIQKAENSGFLFLVVINAVVAVWAAPAVSASDFTQNAHSFREQALGQTLGLVVAYILFAVAGVCIIAGASIHYGADTWNVLDIVQRWDSLFASFFAVLVILMTTISTNATGNIIPAGYQIAAIAPTKLTYKKRRTDCQYYQPADLPVEINGKSGQYLSVPRYYRRNAWSGHWCDDGALFCGDAWAN